MLFVGRRSAKALTCRDAAGGPQNRRDGEHQRSAGGLVSRTATGSDGFSRNESNHDGVGCRLCTRLIVSSPLRTWYGMPKRNSARSVGPPSVFVVYIASAQPHRPQFMWRGLCQNRAEQAWQGRPTPRHSGSAGNMQFEALKNRMENWPLQASVYKQGLRHDRRPAGIISNGARTASG